MLHNCCTGDFPLKLFHGILHVFAGGLDVEPLCGSNVRVTQDRLDHGVRNTEPLVAMEAATVVVSMIVAVMVLSIMMLIVLVMLMSLLLSLPMLLWFLMLLLLLVVLSLLLPSASFSMTRRPIQA